MRQCDVEYVALLEGGGGGGGAGSVTSGGVKPSGAINPMLEPLRTSLGLPLVEVLKYLSSICGETRPSGIVGAGGSSTSCLALNSSAAPLVTATGRTGSLVVCEVSGGVGGIDGVGRETITGGGK